MVFAWTYAASAGSIVSCCGWISEQLVRASGSPTHALAKGERTTRDKSTARETTNDRVGAAVKGAGDVGNRVSARWRITDSGVALDGVG